jgi:hypothetical protein
VEAEEVDLDRRARLAVAGYILMTGAPFVVAATHRWFWQRSHDTAPAAAAVVALLLLALARRHRSAWWVLAVFEVVVIVSFAFDLTSVLALVANVLSLALLLSPPLRRWVGLPTGPGRGASGARASP